MNVSATDVARAASVLVVDDNLDNLRLLGAMLADRGFDVRPVTSGAEALRTVAQAPPDLVLLDVSMPLMDGFEVCARLKQDEATRDVPVIFVTALGDITAKVKGFAAGGTDYITKPFQLEEVLARVSNQLALRDARRQLSSHLERLHELERLRDDLVHMIVHDLRSPLTAMIMNIYALKSRVAGESRDIVGELAKAAEALSGMTNTLLDVRRLEEGKMPLQRVACDLTRIAAEVRGALAVMHRGRTIELDGDGPVVAVCDPALIRRVLENLLSNGIKHSPASGRLRVAIARVAERIRVTVEDEGEGVPPEARQRIFEKFGAVTARADSSYHSAGLGLAFCKLAVLAHHGAIGVESARPKGSRFWFELPATAEDPDGNLA
jgi:two-component system sensor histidine kinase/response regulator